MCTVTIISLGTDEGSYRLAANRDELRSRPEALPPERRRFGARKGVMPIDPLSGGTWIGVNDAGLAMTLLNVYISPLVAVAAAELPVDLQEDGPATISAAAASDSPPGSRGTIIPSLLDCESVEKAAGLAAGLSPAEYSPFRLVMVDGHEIAEAESDGAQIRMTRARWRGEPRFFTSSGLGDLVVDGPRRALFEEFFREGDPHERQDEYHRHSWPDRPHLSVCMRRPEACTVSRTVVETRPRRATLVYFPGAPDLASRSFSVGLSLREGQAS